MHIDHIIPESLANSPEEFARVKQGLGLRDDFDPFGLDNLLPVKPGPNLQKKDLLLNLAAAHFFLNLAANKRADVERNIDRIKRRIESGRALVILQQLVETGQIEPSVMTSLLNGPREEIFRLTKAMEFADSAKVDAIEKAEIADLRNRPFDIEGLELWRGDEQVHVRSCTEYESARKDNFEPRCNVDYKASVFYEHHCGLLSALERATLPLKSNVSDPRIGVADLHLLPFGLFPDLTNQRSEQDNGISYEDKVRDGELLVKRVRTGLLTIQEPAGMGQHLVEVVRADFNGDGLEEILVFEYCYATHGTLGYGGVLLLSRQSAVRSFEFSRI